LQFYIEFWACPSGCVLLMYWIYLLPSTQQTIGCNGFLQRHVSTHTSHHQVTFRTFWF
jgi:hypothetical protein